MLFGHHSAGLLGYSHLTGGYEGGQAEYLRVPYGQLGRAQRWLATLQLRGQGGAVQGGPTVALTWCSLTPPTAF